MKKTGMLMCIALLMAVFGMVNVSVAQPGFQGPQSCTECHELESKAWQGSHHFTSFKKFHKSKDAKKVAKAMGIKRIKKDKTCVQCHYTMMPNKKGKIKPAAGTSCESCHGGSEKWIKEHYDYGGKKVKKAQETAAHKSQRILQSIAGGMIRPDNIYNLARNCFQCHTVPHEKLVEVGGHKAGSEFELVTWSQGEVRHTFVAGKNKAASAERKRVLYLAGRILDLEYGLRGMAEVTANNKYSAAMSKRSKQALVYVKEINDAIHAPALTEILSIGNAVKIEANNKAGLLKAAEAISSKAQAYLKAQDGSDLAALDGLIPSKAIGTPVE